VFDGLTDHAPLAPATFLGIRGASSPRQRLEMMADRDVLPLSADLLNILARAYPHILLIGPPVATDRAVGLMRPHLRRPIVSWSPRDARTLPTECPGTLLIPAIDAATSEQQSHLCAWLDARTGIVQVLSLSVTPLFPLVTGGAFLERLYYRLNQLYVDLARATDD